MGKCLNATRNHPTSSGLELGPSRAWGGTLELAAISETLIYTEPELSHYQYTAIIFQTQKRCYVDPKKCLHFISVLFITVSYQLEFITRAETLNYHCWNWVLLWFDLAWIKCRYRKLWIVGSEEGIAVGEAEYWSVWRWSGQCDYIWRVGWSSKCSIAGDEPANKRTLQTSHTTGTIVWSIGIILLKNTL